ncbi:MAG: homoserine dehydrogenase [Ignavibacteriales bacterium]
MNVGLLGAGTVGGSLLEILARDSERIAAVNGSPVRVIRVLEPDPSKHDRIRSFGAQVALDIEEILGDESIEVVVELIGRVDPARGLVAQALQRGKHVVTANKDLISEHLDELQRIASRRNVALLFEASVCAAIPLLKPLSGFLRFNRIRGIAGIVNGTTNYILTRMAETESPFEEALTEAQRLGFAEADPSADIKGLDAARKICILARLAYGIPVKPGEIPVEGIEGITSKDMVAGKSAGLALKSIAAAVIADEGDHLIDVRVGPAYVSAGSQLASVKDSFNAVEIQGEPVDTLFFVGRGAGGSPTASAIVGDLLEIQRLREAASALSSSRCDYRLLPVERVESRWFVRGPHPALAGELARFGIPVEKSRDLAAPAGETAVFTGTTPDRRLLAAVDRLRESGLRDVRAIRFYR